VRAFLTRQNKDHGCFGPAEVHSRSRQLALEKAKRAIANPLFRYDPPMHVAALFSPFGATRRARTFLGELKEQPRFAVAKLETAKWKRLVSGGEVAFRPRRPPTDADEAIKEGAPVLVVYPDQEDLGTLLMPTTLLRHERRSASRGPRKDSSTISSRRKWSAAWPKAGGSHPASGPELPTPANVRPAAGIRAMHVDYGKSGHGARTHPNPGFVNGWVSESFGGSSRLCVNLPMRVAYRSG